MKCNDKILSPFSGNNFVPEKSQLIVNNNSFFNITQLSVLRKKLHCIIILCILRICLHI